ncbi:MAG: hypothetical protein ACK41Q_09475 [Candidatus Brocadia sp.]
MKRMLEARGLTLHPDKTKIVDATQRVGFDLLEYHFERGMRRPRKKRLYYVIEFDLLTILKQR